MTYGCVHAMNTIWHHYAVLLLLHSSLSLPLRYKYLSAYTDSHKPLLLSLGDQSSQKRVYTGRESFEYILSKNYEQL